MYEPKHRGEYKEEPKPCVACGKRPATELSKAGKDPLLCLPCYYDL